MLVNEKTGRLRSTEKAAKIAVGLRPSVTPRFGLAPPTVTAGSGALMVKGYPLGWNNGYFHRWSVGSEANHNHDLHCVPPFYRAVLRTLRGFIFDPKVISFSRP